MHENYTFKDVWLKNDATVERDAIAAWTQASVLSSIPDPVARTKELAAVAYDGDALIAITSCNLAYLKEVRAKMAMFRLFIAPSHRREGIAISMMHKLFDVMGSYARANPQMRLGGIAAYVQTPGFLKKPITNANLVLIGYSAQNYPIIVKWFEDFVLDSPAKTNA